MDFFLCFIHEVVTLSFMQDVTYTPRWARSFHMTNKQEIEQNSCRASQKDIDEKRKQLTINKFKELQQSRDHQRQVKDNIS